MAGLTEISRKKGLCYMQTLNTWGKDGLGLGRGLAWLRWAGSCSWVGRQLAWQGKAGSRQGGQVFDLAGRAGRQLVWQGRPGSRQGMRLAQLVPGVVMAGRAKKRFCKFGDTLQVKGILTRKDGKERVGLMIMVVVKRKVLLRWMDWDDGALIESDDNGDYSLLRYISLAQRGMELVLK
ncbi:hypothetical protein PPACK8108_LOCUS8159 [Phakopsora pachyrhizi]|uniref:Uncharacterized protein n=1 Tax=Phakopsora pachyrhizi TaxID=170000 RepID=A0AAV0AW04_PHAPC|nr:hypothetical protein PPACK8108_LOCUS8159 [Phakopsora pachyrhizi]